MKKKHLYAVILGASLLLAGIQPAHAINIPGDDSYYDIIDGVYVLNQSVYETINIVSDGITLDGNAQVGHTVTGSGPGYGVYLSGKNGVTIRNLTVTNFASSGYSGIFLQSCNDVDLIGNNISNNYWGIELDGGCVSGTVTGNDVSNNAGGIWLDAASNGNTVEGNIVSDNGANGIYIRDSSDNIVKNNTSSGNNVGIRLNKQQGWTCTNNQIYNNNFIGNVTQADFYVGSTGNVFNLASPIGGNYWNNWTSPDSDGNGFVDNPYLIYEYGTQNLMAQDNLPWTVQDGWLAPVNQPPVADAGPDQTVECQCQRELGTLVTLDGSGSYDPDLDPLTYTWTGPFVGNPITVSDPVLTVTLDGCRRDCVNEITLVVNDGNVDSEPDTVLITVQDTTPPDMTPPADPGDTIVEAMGPDGVPIDDDEIQIFLAGASADDDCDPEPVITNDAPDVFLPGDTLVTFTATESHQNPPLSSTCSSTVTVVEAAESHLRIVPRIINRKGRLRKILAVIRFPEGTAEEDIDMDVPLVLYPGDSPYGIVATHQRIVTWCRWGTLRVCMFGFFPKDDVTAAVPEDGWVEFMVVGRFVDGQYFYGFRMVKIVSWSWKCW